MRLLKFFLVAGILLPAVYAVPAAADDWAIAKLSGDAFVFFQGRWTPLRLGDIVADDSFVRTLANGSLQFTRDHELIDVEPNTEIQIVDRTGKRYTTVRQYMGTVGVEANREKIQHFEVRTPFLAAVVKGTVFGVTTTGQTSTVAVTRGKVGVHSAVGHTEADVTPGKTATVARGQGVSVGHSSAAAASAASAASSSSSAAASAASAAAAASSAASAASASAASSSASSASAAASSASSSSAAASSASASAAASSGASSSGASSSGASSGAGAGHDSAAATASASPANGSSAKGASTANANGAGSTNGTGKGKGIGHGAGTGHGGIGQGASHGAGDAAAGQGHATGIGQAHGGSGQGDGSGDGSAGHGSSGAAR